MQDSPVTSPSKEIWIQLNWEPQEPGNVPTLQFIDPLGLPTTLPLSATVLWQGDPVNTWREVVHSMYHFDIYPNPAYESFQISGGINVDEFVVNTYCVGVPEPATWTYLLLVGAACCLAFCRQRRRLRLRCGY